MGVGQAAENGIEWGGARFSRVAIKRELWWDQMKKKGKGDKGGEKGDRTKRGLFVKKALTTTSPNIRQSRAHWVQTPSALLLLQHPHPFPSRRGRDDKGQQSEATCTMGPPIVVGVTSAGSSSHLWPWLSEIFSFLSSVLNAIVTPLHFTSTQRHVRGATCFCCTLYT